MRYYACFCTTDQVNYKLDDYVGCGWQLKLMTVVAGHHGGLSTYCLLFERPDEDV